MTEITSDYADWQHEVIEKARLRDAPTASAGEWQRDLNVFISGILNERAEVPPPPPPPSDPLPVTPAGLTLPTRLLWHDEFDGDLSKWNVIDESTYGASNHTVHTYVQGNADIDGGRLLLSADYMTSRVESGMVTTRAMGGPEKFAFKQGYIEAKMRCPLGAWAWPALWLVGAQGGPPWPAYGEVDIIEAYPADGAFESNFHRTGGYIGGRNHASQLDQTQGRWHTFGLLWTPLELVWVYDGKIVRSYNVKDVNDTSALALPHTIHLNLAVGGDGPAYHGFDGNLAGLAGNPEALEVEYVRVWQ